MAQSQEQAILQRSLQDKAAEVEVERMSAKVVAEPGRGWVGSGVPLTTAPHEPWGGDRCLHCILPRPCS